MPDKLDEVKRRLRDGLDEIGDDIRDEAGAFVDAFAVEIVDITARAAAGDEAAKLSLGHLREQAFTHAYIAKLRAEGVTQDVIRAVIGIAIRAALAV